MGDPIWPEGAVIRRAHWHFHQRLHERYHGMILDPGGFTEILRQIKDGDAVRLPRDGYAVRVRRQGHRPRWVYVIAFPDRDDLVTAREPRHGMKDAVRAAKAERAWTVPGLPRMLHADPPGGPANV